MYAMFNYSTAFVTPFHLSTTIFTPPSSQSQSTIKPRNNRTNQHSSNPKPSCNLLNQQSQITRRDFTKLLPLLAIPFLPLPLSANAATLLPPEEVRNILLSVSTSLTSSLPDSWSTLPSKELRSAFRSGPASRLRAAVIAVPQLCSSNSSQKAMEIKGDAIRALEAADLAALRASRGQKGGETEVVDSHLNDLKIAVDSLLRFLEESDAAAETT